MISMLAAVTIDVQTVIVGLLSGGMIGGLVSVSRVRVDKNKVVVDAAQGAVVIQEGVLRAVTAQRDEYKALSEAREQRIAVLELDADRLRLERDRALRHVGEP
jgi:hypothetical protein